MARIAIVEKCPSNNKYENFFTEEFDVFHLSSVRLTKVLKKDVDIQLDTDKYEYIILIGSEAVKYYLKNYSVTEHAGLLLNEKFIPMLNPAMLHFKPEIQESFNATLKKIHKILQGEDLINDKGDWSCIRNTEAIKDYLREILLSDNQFVMLDTEGTALYPRDGHVIGISICNSKRKAGYFDTDFFDEDCCSLLQQIINTKEIVFHNAKYDMKMMSYHFNLIFREGHTHDTLVLHYILDETQGTHGLKSLAIKFTDYGDYDRELDEFKKYYCKTMGIKEEDFTYDLIPWEIISKYGCIDTGATHDLFHKFYPIVMANPKFKHLYENIMMPGIFCLNEIEENGIPLDVDRLEFARAYLHNRLLEETASLYEYDEVKQLEEDQGDRFNPNSVVQLRRLLFDYVGLSPTGKMTATGAHSTDADVLEELSSEHPIAKNILNIRKLAKLKNTYVEKLLPQIDADGRIRTFFNLTSTTSGRLSSSGKFNAQQLPRDDPIIKGVIKAKPGYRIVSMDLVTGEMYYAAVLSKDKNLQSLFKQKGDFHSITAKEVFKLNCLASEVKELFPKERQAIKSTSFGLKI